MSRSARKQCTAAFRGGTYCVQILQARSAIHFQMVSFVHPAGALLFQFGWCFVFNSTFTQLFRQEGKRWKARQPDAKALQDRETWQVSVLIPFPSGRHASSVWQSVRKQVPMATPAGYRDLTGKDRKRERVQCHFLSLQQGFLFLRHISSPEKKKKKSLWSRLPYMVSHNTRAHTLWEKSPHSRPNARQKFPNTLVQCERSKTMPGSVSVSHTFIKAKVCRMGVQRLLNGSWLSTPGMCCATAHGKCSSNLRNHMKTRALIYANTIKDNWYICVRSYRKQEQSIAWTYGKPLHKNHTSPTSYVSRCKLLFK